MVSVTPAGVLLYDVAIDQVDKICLYVIFDQEIYLYMLFVCSDYI